SLWASESWGFAGPKAPGAVLGRVAAIAQHHTMSARSVQPGTQPVGFVARLGAYANLIEIAKAAARERVNDHRVVPGENDAVFAFDRGVVGESLAAREPGAQLSPPRACSALAEPPLQLRHEGVRLALHNDSQVFARRSRWTFLVQISRTSRG